VKDVADAAKGYNALALQHGAEPNAPVVKEVLAKLHDKGMGTPPREEVGQVLYMRGLISAMLATVGMRVAQAKYGKGKTITGEQMRWGLENMNLTTIGLTSLGFNGVMRTTSTSCNDHMGASWARVHTWNGKGWEFTSDWYEGDRKVIGPMVTETANKYAADKKLTRRPASDCNS
jgi:branched-chain amino acid transport system substrate-binding protein